MWGGQGGWVRGIGGGLGGGRCSYPYQRCIQIQMCWPVLKHSCCQIHLCTMDRFHIEGWKRSSDEGQGVVERGCNL